MGILGSHSIKHRTNGLYRTPNPSPLEHSILSDSSPLACIVKCDRAYWSTPKRHDPKPPWKPPVDTSSTSATVTVVCAKFEYLLFHKVVCGVVIILIANFLVGVCIKSFYNKSVRYFVTYEQGHPVSFSLSLEVISFMVGIELNSQS